MIFTYLQKKTTQKKSIEKFVYFLQIELNKTNIFPHTKLNELAIDSLQKAHLLALFEKHYSIALNISAVSFEITIEQLVKRYHKKKYKINPEKISVHNTCEKIFLNDKELKLLKLQENQLDNPAYQIGACIEFQQSLDLDLFKLSLLKVQETTFNLRIFIKENEKIETQNTLIPFAYESLENLPYEKQIEKIQQTFYELKKKINNPKIWPLYQVRLFQQTTDKYCLIILMHHLISDAISLNNYLKKCFAAYHQQFIQQDKHAIIKVQQVENKNLLDLKFIQSLENAHVTRFLPKLNEKFKNGECLLEQFTLVINDTKQIFKDRLILNSLILVTFSNLSLNFFKQQEILIKVSNHARYDFDKIKLIGYLADANIFHYYPMQDALFYTKEKLESFCSKQASYDSYWLKLNKNKMPELCFNFIDVSSNYPDNYKFLFHPPKNNMWNDEIKLSMEVFILKDTIKFQCTGLKNYFTKEQLSLFFSAFKNLIHENIDNA